MLAQARADAGPNVAANIVPIRLRVTTRHRGYLLLWLQAGRRMGLHDTDIVHATPERAHPDGLVLIWVREAADPAYRVQPDRMRWLVIDHPRDHVLGQFNDFAAALNFIRPVLPAVSA